MKKKSPPAAPACGKAVLHSARLKGRQAVVKNYSNSSTMFRYTCGLYMAHREERAYRRLKGIEGVPELLERRWPDGLVIECIQGRNCLDQKNPNLSSAFFLRLRLLLQSIRARRVLHGDVKRNVLVDIEGKPIIIDFGASFVIPWWLHPMEKMILTLGARYDERAVLKLKRQISPGMLTVEEEAMICELPLENVVKNVEGLIRTITRKIVNLEMRHGP